MVGTGTAGDAGGGTGAPVGSGGVVGETGLLVADFPLSDMIDEDDGKPDIYASVREVSIKTIAAPVVILLRNEVPPPAPNTDWLPLLPKDAPISAPFPDCSNTTAIRKILTITCNMVSAIVIT